MMNETEIILNADDMERSLGRMTHQILEKHSGTENLTLIGIHTRGVFLARRLGRRIQALEGVEVPTGELDITLYRDDWTRISQHPIVQATDILFGVDGKRIILVDDVLFTGRTTRAAMDAVIDFGRPERIELAVLVDRGHRELPIQADYIGKYIDTRRAETVNVHLADFDGKDEVVLTRTPS
jgi:pyrimidine operon attenuation protein/uracil phosphoribosyltransferase